MSEITPDNVGPLSDDDMAVATPPRVDIYDDGNAIRHDIIEAVVAAIELDEAIALDSLVADLHSSELGDLIEALPEAARSGLVQLLGEDFDFAALTEIDDSIRADLMELIPNQQIADAVKDLESDDAVYILEDMDGEDRDEILESLPFQERIKLRRSLDYPEESAGRRMQSEFVAVPPFWSVGQTIDYMRENEELPESFTQIFVVDPTFHLLGAIDLDRILRARRAVKIEELMRNTHRPIQGDMDQEEAAQIFEQYDLVSEAVVDHDGRLVGVLTIDDVVDVIQQEAEEDILRLGGVGAEELSDSVYSTTKSRFLWLLINLGTAILASIVIGAFGSTIEQMVALAVLMPIVASMGGNAGTQTMTVTVRALATKDLDIYNSARIIRREVTVGVLNGIIFAVLIGIVASFWFGSSALGLVIAIAMVINMVAAALAGILIPMVLDKVGADPAIASSVFVTTVTDVVGFLAFLGLASAVLL